MNQTMQVMMPLMFGYFTTQFASGLAIYFVISNVVGIAIQWAIERWGAPAAPAVPEVPAAPATNKEKVPYGRKKQRRKAKR